MLAFLNNYLEYIIFLKTYINYKGNMFQTASKLNELKDGKSNFY
jgi:hypothetical protein